MQDVGLVTFTDVSKIAAYMSAYILVGRPKGARDFAYRHGLHMADAVAQLLQRARRGWVMADVALPLDLRIRVPSCQRRHVVEHQITGAEAATICSFLLFSDNREGAKHVLGFLTVQPIEEEQGIQACAAPQPVFGIPAEWGTIVPKVTSERGHIVRHVGQRQRIL